MRKLIYLVCASLDGFIASPEGDYDWIPRDETIDFGAIFARFDILLMGRRTYEHTLTGPGFSSGKRVVVVSSTIESVGAGVELISKDVAERVQALKQEQGKDIWLFGGGSLFRSLLDRGLVDGIEVAISPVLLGGGVPLIDPGARSPMLELVEVRTTPAGFVGITYRVPQPSSS